MSPEDEDPQTATFARGKDSPPLPGIFSFVLFQIDMGTASLILHRGLAAIVRVLRSSTS